MANKILSVYLLFFAAFPVLGQNRQWNDLSTKQTSKAAEELMEFLAIPNDAAQEENVRKNITWLDQAFTSRGFTTETLETSGRPYFFAEYRIAGAQSTLLFYMHFDGQPVKPASWEQGLEYSCTNRSRSPSPSISTRCGRGMLKPPTNGWSYATPSSSWTSIP